VFFKLFMNNYKGAATLLYLWELRLQLLSKDSYEKGILSINCLKSFTVHSESSWRFTILIFWNGSDGIK